MCGLQGNRSARGRQVDWFFDVISPFAYLQLENMDSLPGDLQVMVTPVLLGGMLTHWQAKGPAEIPEKRKQTYRMAQWRARRMGIEFRMPPAHPFNPLPALRLATALRIDLDGARRLMRHIWRDGQEVGTEAGFDGLCAVLGLSAETGRLMINRPQVKERLRRNTETACARGLFGVPTFIVDAQQFWGEDATDMLADYLADPAMFTRDDYPRIDDLPIGLQRLG